MGKDVTVKRLTAKILCKRGEDEEDGRGLVSVVGEELPSNSRRKIEVQGSGG